MAFIVPYIDGIVVKRVDSIEGKSGDEKITMNIQGEHELSIRLYDGNETDKELMKCTVKNIKLVMDVEELKACTSL